MCAASHCPRAAMKVARSAPVIGVIGQLQNVAEKQNRSSQCSHWSQVANKEPEPDVVFILIFLLILWVYKVCDTFRFHQFPLVLRSLQLLKLQTRAINTSTHQMDSGTCFLANGRGNELTDFLFFLSLDCRSKTHFSLEGNHPLSCTPSPICSSSNCFLSLLCSRVE